MVDKAERERKSWLRDADTHGDADADTYSDADNEEMSRDKHQ